MGPAVLSASDKDCRDQIDCGNTFLGLYQMSAGTTQQHRPNDLLLLEVCNHDMLGGGVRSSRTTVIYSAGLFSMDQ